MQVSSYRKPSVGRGILNDWGAAATTHNTSPSTVSTEDEAEILLSSFLRPKDAPVAPLTLNKAEDVLHLPALNRDTTRPTSFQRLTLADKPETSESKHLRNQQYARSLHDPSPPSLARHSSKAQEIGNSSSGGTRLSPVIPPRSQKDLSSHIGSDNSARRSLGLDPNERSTRGSLAPNQVQSRKRDAGGQIRRSSKDVQANIEDTNVEERVRNKQGETTNVPDISPLSQRRDALRTRLLQTGLWYEDVDRLIHYCEDGRAEDDDAYHVSGLILMPAESRCLTLPKALELLNGLDVFADQGGETDGEAVRSPAAPSLRASSETEQAVTPLNRTRSLPDTCNTISFSGSQAQRAHSMNKASSQSLSHEDNSDTPLEYRPRFNSPADTMSSQAPPLKATASRSRNKSDEALDGSYRDLNRTRPRSTGQRKGINSDLQDKTAEPACEPKLSALEQTPALHTASKDSIPISDTSPLPSLQTLREVVSSGKATPKQMRAFNDHINHTLSRSSRAETSSRQRNNSRSIEAEASSASKSPAPKKDSVLNFQDEAITIMFQAALADEKALKTLRRAVASGAATPIQKVAYQRYLDLSYTRSSGEDKEIPRSTLSYSGATVHQEHETAASVSTTKHKKTRDLSKILVGKSGPKSGKSARSDPSMKVATRSVVHRIPATPSKTSTAGLLNIIRLGVPGRRGLHASATTCLKSQNDNHLRIWKSWKGASHDVIHAAWSNDGTKYAVGTAALVDPHTMQYNRPNNLLVGNIVSNTLTEVPDHHTARPNRRVADRSGLDPRLFQTITAVRWPQGTDGGNRLYTTSYDHTVKIWNTADTSNVTCLSSAWHTDRVTELAISAPELGLFATGTENANDGLRIFRYEEANQQLSATSLKLGASSLTRQHTTTCLQYGQTSVTQEYLAAGFARIDPEDDGFITAEGVLSVWRQTPTSAEKLNLRPCSQNVFDIAWHPSGRYFATANAAPLSARKKSRVRSMVRVYDPQQASRLIEYDCPAADLNTVTFCPTNTDYITASATNGRTYVWDFRRPDQILHELAHGVPIPELPHDRPQELVDVGVRVALWGRDTSRFYTGGSDGLLKEWDIRKATVDALTRDVVRLDAEIMSGAFSPDGSFLVLGDAAGGVHLLSKAPIDDFELDFVAAASPERDTTEDPWTEGRRAAAELVESGQIEIVPGWGAGKGRNYQGPWASWAGPEDRKAKVVARRQEKRKQSIIESSPTSSSQKPSIIISDDDELEAKAAAARREKRRRKKEKKLSKELKRQAGLQTADSTRASSKKSSAFIDLTLSGDDEEEENTWAAALVDDDLFEDDAWFPPHWMVDANIKVEEV